jgi:hypothetical protein
MKRKRKMLQRKDRICRFQSIAKSNKIISSSRCYFAIILSFLIREKITYMKDFFVNNRIYCITHDSLLKLLLPPLNLAAVNATPHNDNVNHVPA